MDAAVTAQILILAGDEPTARRWAAMLAGAESRVWLAAEDVPDPARVELILTDQDISFVVTRFIGSNPFDPREDRMNAVTTNLPPRAAATGPPGPGVIRIGPEGPADVCLPADATERELRLACRLLAEVVRLRHKDYALSLTQRRLAEEVLTDPLTGLPNRRAWDRVLRERTAAGDMAGRLCLAILDLDHFKRVNDAHGHPAGDEVLRAAGQVISGGLRETDFVARLGGDEFGLLLPVRDEAMARAVVERVRTGLPSGLARRGIKVVTASAGFSLTSSARPTPAQSSPDELFASADAALAQAKRQGRDQTVSSPPQ
jgi:diguanylate cyclase (GGDEF)-like protein